MGSWNSRLTSVSGVIEMIDYYGLMTQRVIMENLDKSLIEFIRIYIADKQRGSPLEHYVTGHLYGYLFAYFALGLISNEYWQIDLSECFRGE